MLSESGRVLEALREISESAGANPENGPMHGELAWLLAVSTDGRLREAEGAADLVLKLAQRGVALTPGDSRFHTALGIAHYRLGNWEDSNAALWKSRQLDSNANPVNHFFEAMSRWQQGEQQRARRIYRAGVLRMQRKNSDDEQLNRLRAESADLLGLTVELSGGTEETTRTAPTATSSTEEN